MASLFGYVLGTLAFECSRKDCLLSLYSGDYSYKLKL